MRSQLPFAFFFIQVSAAAVLAAAPAADPPGAFTLQAPRWHMESAVDGEAVVQLAKGSDKVRSFTLQCTCLRDADRFDAQTIRFEGAMPVRAWRSVLDGCYLSYQVPARGKSAVAGFFAADGRNFGGASIPSCLAPFLGYFAGDCLSVAQIKQSTGQVRLSETTLNGTTCQRISFDSPDYGHYQIDYDGGAGYLPRAARVSKAGRNYLGQSRLSEEPARTPLGSAGPTTVQELTFALDDVKLELMAGQWFPASCRITRVLRYADGNAETTTMLWRRTRLEIDPVLPVGAFKADLRDGAPLANLSQSHLPFRWKDGKAVPEVDGGLVAQMNQTAQSLRRERESSRPGAR